MCICICIYIYIYINYVQVFGVQGLKCSRMAIYQSQAKVDWRILERLSAPRTFCENFSP